MTDKPVVIIGYGNTLRRDDGVGWAAAHRLYDRLDLNSANILAVQQLLPELAEPISRAKLAIFVDADATLQPGEIRRRNVEPDAARHGVMAHDQTPQGLLGVASDLYGQRPKAVLYSIGGKDFSFGCRLSPRVKVALARVVAEIVHMVHELSMEDAHA